MIQQTKICSKCKTEKYIDDFFKVNLKNKNSLLRPACKKCINEDNLKRSRIQREKFIERAMQWAKNNPEKRYKIGMEANWRAQGIITKNQIFFCFEDYETLFKACNGVCMICQKQIMGKKRRLCVDHNHKNGIVRGLVCNRCNNCLSLFDENENNLERIKKYLEGSLFDLNSLIFE